MRAEGKRRGIADFRVGSCAVAFNNADGVVAPFAKAHPEAWTRWRPRPDALDSSAYFDPSAKLKVDRGCFAGIPGGIVDGMPVHAAFAAQWGALANKVGLDAIMLRDGIGFPRPYTRYGPWELAVPDRATADRFTGGMAAMLRGMKEMAPRALTMMFSTAATATSDWRANGLDLETLARAGDLDIFVDQTWGGAWGEVGVRQQTFWNAPILGWTYQLGYLLQHRAMLSGTRVRHYFITETFDAWESGSTITTARDRLRWAIWAWSNVGAKTPRGLEMTAGSYISWGNSGRDLIAPVDVAFLSDTLNDAFAVAAATLASQFATKDALRLAQIDLAETVTLSAWTVRGDGLRILAGNLEEGLRDDADGSRHITVTLPKDWRDRRWTSWDNKVRADFDEVLPLTIDAQGSLLLRGRRSSNTHVCLSEKPLGLCTPDTPLLAAKYLLRAIGS